MRSIFAKRLFLERSKFFFSKSFAVLKNGFIIVMYSKAKQTANKYGEKRIKKIDSKKQKSKDRRERETKSPFCGKPIFEAWKIKNSPVRFGAIK